MASANGVDLGSISPATVGFGGFAGASTENHDILNWSFTSAGTTPDDLTISEGETFAGSGSFTDPGTADTHTGTVDYGDGSGEQPLALNPDKTFDLEHSYADNGTTR